MIDQIENIVKELLMIGATPIHIQLTIEDYHKLNRQLETTCNQYGTRINRIENVAIYKSIELPSVVLAEYGGFLMHVPIGENTKTPQSIRAFINDSPTKRIFTIPNPCAQVSSVSHQDHEGSIEDKPSAYVPTAIMDLTPEQWQFLESEMKKPPTQKQLETFKRAEKVYNAIKPHVQAPRVSRSEPTQGNTDSAMAHAEDKQGVCFSQTENADDNKTVN